MRADVVVLQAEGIQPGLDVYKRQVIYLVLIAHVDILRRGIPGAIEAPGLRELARQID